MINTLDDNSPPVTVKELLVENGSIGAKEGNGVKGGRVNGIL